jgi:hypothetical protein
VTSDRTSDRDAGCVPAAGRDQSIVELGLLMAAGLEAEVF